MLLDMSRLAYYFKIFEDRCAKFSSCGTLFKCWKELASLFPEHPINVYEDVYVQFYFQFIFFVVLANVCIFYY
jgi:hypothetical protein